MQHPKLRDSKRKKTSDLYPLGEIPDSVVYEIGKRIIYYYTVGKKDINGEDWGDIFAEAIGGEHLSSPLGLADVVLDKKAWSVKSVKHGSPHKCKVARVISGRNSPDYSYGIKNPHDDIQKTGTAVLGIWNERVNIALDNFNSLRTSILIREPEKLEFTLLEIDTHRYVTSEYKWSVNKNGNLEGYTKDNKHAFTWQPHGSQFTIKHDVLGYAKKFSIKKPPVLEFEKTMEQIGFQQDWITIKS